MENCVGSTIEKIKLLEQDKKAKLKEKRELEATVAAYNRALKECSFSVQKAIQEEKELLQRTDRLRAQLKVDETRRNALAQQLDACYAELNELRSKTDQGMSEVWKLRSTLSAAVQHVSDNCDVWPLLTKPLYPEPVDIAVDIKEEEPSVALLYESKLYEAKIERDKMRAEKERLQNDPECGEEFVRIKNALCYCLENVSKLKKV